MSHLRVCHCQEFPLWMYRIEFMFQTACIVYATYVTAFCLYRLKFRFCLNRQRSSGSVKGKYTKYRLHIASLRFYAFSNMRSQISSSFLRHGHLPIREVNCYRRLSSSLRISSSSSSNLFFRMIARTFGKFPPRNVANGYGTLKTAIQTP